MLLAALADLLQKVQLYVQQANLEYKHKHGSIGAGPLNAAAAKLCAEFPPFLMLSVYGTKLHPFES